MAKILINGELWTVTELPEAELVEGEIHATHPTHGGCWFRLDEVA